MMVFALILTSATLLTASAGTTNADIEAPCHDSMIAFINRIGNCDEITSWPKCMHGRAASEEQMASAQSLVCSTMGVTAFKTVHISVHLAAGSPEPSTAAATESHSELLKQPVERSALPSSAPALQSLRQLRVTGFPTPAPNALTHAKDGEQHKTTPVEALATANPMWDYLKGEYGWQPSTAVPTAAPGATLNEDEEDSSSSCDCSSGSKYPVHHDNGNVQKFSEMKWWQVVIIMLSMFVVCFGVIHTKGCGAFRQQSAPSGNQSTNRVSDPRDITQGALLSAKVTV